MRLLTGLGVGLAVVVVLLGAWTRLVDAGLGCPDWPGCYGFIGVPTTEADIQLAETRFPETPVEADKAWPEMVHRYFASGLGLLIIGICVLAWRGRKAGADLPLKLPLFLLGLVILQGAFGAWTVTLKLWPQVVTAHLLGGFATLSLLWLLYMRLSPWSWQGWHAEQSLRGLAVGALIVVVLQVALGGWVSSNYAALACPDFPTCQGEVWPEMDFAEGLNVWQSVGPNYLGGQLDNEGRVAIQVLHRLGALIVLVVVGLLAFRLWRSGSKLGALLAAGLVGQIALGILNVVWVLPLPVATAHNGGGALVTLLLVTVNYRAFAGPLPFGERGRGSPAASSSPSAAASSEAAG